MSPENQFKKACVIFLVIMALYVVMTSPYVSDFSKNIRKQVFYKYFSYSDIDIEKEHESEPNKFQLMFAKQNPKLYWISGRMKINNLSDYNNQSREQIYSFRKYYVSKSIFKNVDYVPNEDVFGGMKDGGKWLGIRALACSGISAYSFKGMSAESKFINNPAILVGVDYADYSKKYIPCSQSDYLKPVNLSFSKDDNLFQLTYRLSEKMKNKDLKLVGLNARDLGFNYIYSKKVNNIKFMSELDNVSKNIVEFKDAIRIDKSCGSSGGCNRNMAYQEEMKFNITTLPASFELSLWKQKPETTDVLSDMNFTIIIE